jgi:phosphoribosyl-ATP pyrophosphohydrolase/phosphoribosyl-AMP cyclohydrolase
MMIPSLDLMGGHAVQLVGGQRLEVDAGDPRPIAERFALTGEIAVVDLDAALGRGSNAALIRELLTIAPCRVGGGIRSIESAVAWLDEGAAKVVIGTAAVPELLSKLPRERVIVALDALDGEVVVEGWRTRTRRSPVERMRELRGLAGGFLVTFVEREGRLGGTRLEAVRELVGAAGDARLTIAGGVTTAAEIAELDRLGADAQVGMALYKGVLNLADALAAPLVSDRPDGLWPTVVVDDQGVALGLAYSSRESLRQAVAARCGVYHSRSRGLWVKGETSRDTQELLRVDLDCDRDALRFTVRQRGRGFCHSGTRTCWGPDRGLPHLARRLASRAGQPPPGSYTGRLLRDPELLAAKLREEAAELAEVVRASRATSEREVVAEAADVVYFVLVALARAGVPLESLTSELDRRALRISRRPGNAKAPVEPPT